MFYGTLLQGNGSTYLYINKVNSTGKPLTDEFYWKCLAKRGLSAFEVWDIMNGGGNKTEAQFFDFIQSPANDAKMILHCCKARYSSTRVYATSTR